MTKGNMLIHHKGLFMCWVAQKTQHDFNSRIFMQMDCKQCEDIPGISNFMHHL